VGGVFLVIKTILEIGEKIYGKKTAEKSIGALSMKSAIAQIIFLDVIFSFDSILTAVGLVRNVMIMIFAVVIAMIAMLIFSGKVSDFIEKHPTVKMLALAFLMLIGFSLFAEGLAARDDDDLARQELASLVRVAMADLPAEQGEVLVLKLWEGLTFAEIAEVVEAPPNTVASRYRYALDKLAPRLRGLVEAEEGQALTSGTRLGRGVR
jgi:RNA polymerase sigma factor (sigma-70 family)